VLRALVEKEIKDLIRDPRIWIPVLIGFLMLPLIGLIQNIGLSSQISQAYGRPITAQLALVGSYSGAGEFLETLRAVSRGYNISYTDSREAFPRSADALVVINLSSIGGMLQGGRLETYIVYKARLGSLSTGQDTPARIQQSIVEASRIYLARLNNLTGILPTLVAPASAYTVPYIQERSALIVSIDASQLLSLVFIPIMIPMVLLMISVFILQYSAVSMAVENEERTLEILLSMPIPRWSIVLAKLAASGLVGLLSLAGLALGLYVYTAMLASSIRGASTGLQSIASAQVEGIPLHVIGTYIPGADVRSVSDLVSLSPHFLIVATIYSLEAVVLAGIVGIIIGGASSDVRMANTVAGSLTPALAILWLAMVYMDPESLPAQILLSNPLTGLPFYSRLAILGGYGGSDIYAYLALSGVEAAVMAYLAGKTLNLETLERVRKGLSFMRRARG